MCVSSAQKEKDRPHPRVTAWPRRRVSPGGLQRPDLSVIHSEAPVPHEGPGTRPAPRSKWVMRPAQMAPC
ncbi:unnamed protein product [Arctogadus glacialis]